MNRRGLFKLLAAIPFIKSIPWVKRKHWEAIDRQMAENIMFHGIPVIEDPHIPSGTMISFKFSGYPQIVQNPDKSGDFR